MITKTRVAFEGSGFRALGWFLYIGFCEILIIPTAWAVVAFYRWIIRNLSFSDGTKATFIGKGEEVWGYYSLLAFFGLVPLIFRIIDNSTTITYLSLGFVILTIPITTYIGLVLMRWLCSNILFENGKKLSFKGNYTSYLGWILLVTVSAYTIIGWAWASTAMIRWICRETDAGNNKIEFRGSGGQLLLRTLLAGLASILIIPIPWVWLWVFKWLIGNVELIGNNISRSSLEPNHNVFFCFSVEDASRAKIVRDAWIAKGNEAKGFVNESERIELLGKGDQAIKDWIDAQLDQTTTSVVLVGNETCKDQWVKYSINKSIENGNNLLGIDISKIKDTNGNKSVRCGRIPQGYPFYYWFKDGGVNNIKNWIENSDQVQIQKPPALSIEQSTKVVNSGTIPSPGASQIQGHYSKVCPGCGKPIEPDWEYCGHCGIEYPFMQVNSESHLKNSIVIPPNLIASSDYDTQNGNPHKRRLKLIIGGFVVLVLTMVIFLVVFLNRSVLNGGPLILSTTLSPFIQDNQTVENLTITPAAIFTFTPNTEPISDEVQLQADRYFSSGAEVFIYDPQPTSVSLMALPSTEFTLHYILSNNAESVSNVVLIWRVNSAGTKEYSISDRSFIEDWETKTGTLTFSTFNMYRDIYRQQYSFDPNQGVLQAWVGMTPLYGGLNEFYVDDPIYLDVFLVTPEKQGETLILSEESNPLSNSVRIEVTP